MPRPARQYSRRVDIYSSIANDDGYGGKENVSSVTLLGTVWANLTTVPQAKLIEFGLDVAQSNIQIYMRKDTNIDMNQPNIFLTISGVDYTVTSVTEYDLDGVEIEIIASA